MTSTRIPPALSPRRTQSERRDTSEQALLLAAAEIVEAEGFAAITFERVGAVAGYSRGLAAQRFGSKDGLVRAVIEFISGRLQARMDAALAGIISPSAQIRAWFDTLLQQVESDPVMRAYFVMMAAAVGNRAAIRQAFFEQHEQVRDHLRLMIEAARDAGEVSAAVDADTSALAMGSLQMGIAIELMLDPNMDLAAMRQTAQRAIAGMLGLSGR